MANLSQLEHILQLCRKYGVTALDTADVKLVLGPAPGAPAPGASSTSEQVDPLTGLTKTQAELLFHSVAE
jgi:hypothetical protein